MSAAFVFTLKAEREELLHASHQRIVIAEAGLRSAVLRYQYLPSVLMLDAEVRDLLGDPRSAARVAALNLKFETVARNSGAAVVYLLDREGRALSASDWSEPLTFIGKSYAYRPYFKEAVATGASRYFGVGATTNKPGLFLGRAVPAANGEIAGVVVVKVDLEGLQGEWRRANEHILVSDASGVVFLASESAWKYRPFQRLGAADSARIREARQYGDSDLRPLLDRPTPERGEEIRFGAADRVLAGFLEGADMPDLGWRLWYLSPAEPALRQAQLAALVAGAACLAFAFALVAAGQRRQRLRSEQAMRIALEQRVADRTRDLVDVNARLRGEIAERERATAALRATQDELIHAGRLAALGQISTAISHEVNQPLAALRTFLASTRVFLERGDVETTRGNLERMTKVTERISEIIRHLKDFVRKTRPEAREAVRLRDVADAALDLLQSRIRAEGVVVSCSISPDAAVLAEPVRLEQVILNLMVNALDAMRNTSDRRLDLTASREADCRWRLAVADSGTGIAEDDLPRLFDPFFTTKAAGEGLGLGLSLSQLIATDFGGGLSAANGAHGAVLSLVLPAAET